MDEIQSWFAGVDWASQKHDVWLADASGKRLGKRTFAHSGEGLPQMCGWLMVKTHASFGSPISRPSIRSLSGASAEAWKQLAEGFL